MEFSNPINSGSSTDSYRLDRVNAAESGAQPLNIDGSGLISIIIPVFREERNIAALITELDRSLALEVAYRWEYIFVNDGSPDNSISVLEHFCKTHNRCKVVDLSRNFGKEIALTAGLSYASGDAVICMDADLQHPPRYIPELLRAWERGAEVVSAVRQKSEKQSLFRKLSSFIFYWLMDNFTELDMASKATDFRLLDQKVVEAMRSIGEKQRIFRGLVDWLGFKKDYIEFHAVERLHGSASYSTSKLVSLAINSFVSYSTFPLKIVGAIGIFVTLMSSCLLTYMVADHFLLGNHWSFTPLAMFVVGNSFLFGITVAMLGLISLYIRKIYSETINRPLFVVRKISGF